MSRTRKALGAVWWIGFVLMVCSFAWLFAVATF